MMPSSSDLQYFLAVAETLNISRAAERLGITQPSLSLSIQRLEHSVGLSLFLRSKTGVQLTRGGQRLKSQAQALLSDWEKITDEIQKDETEVRGRFTIGCHPSVALYTLPSILPTLVSKYPGLEIKLEHDLSRRITEDVISYKIDFGIVINPVAHSDLVIRKLGVDYVMLWTAAKPTPTQNPVSGDGILILDPELLQSQQLLRDFAKAKMNFKRQITSSNLEVVASLVAAGVGAGILPSLVARRIKSFGLKPLPGDGPKFKDNIALVYRADTQRSTASKTIMKLIEQSITGLGD